MEALVRSMSETYMQGARVGGFQIGSYPDRVQGTEFVEAAEEKYKRNYALRTCLALQQADPETFKQVFGDLATCVYKAGAFADANFDMWKITWPRNLASAIATFG